MLSWARSMKAWSAITTSVLFHAGLLIVFAAIRWGLLPEAQLQTIAAGFSATHEVETITTLPELSDAPTENSGGAVTAPDLLNEIVEPLPVATVVDTVAEKPAAKEPAKQTAPKIAALMKGNGTGQSNGDGAGQGGSFFDASAEGDRVVYVVDCSRSMNRFFPSEERTRFGRVKRELINSIRKLRPEQRFFVIYFNTIAHPMPAGQMISRESFTLMDNLRWVAGFQTVGKTNPEPALMMALKLEPDAVFFLTDGDFRANIVDNVVEANFRKTPIHAIGFGNDVQDAKSDAVDLLGGLSSQTGGRLTLISDDGTIHRQ